MTFQHIPLHHLFASPDNVRRTDTKADIDALAASILAHGVLQNLNVKQRDARHYEVAAGSRRHAALKKLWNDGKIARDYLVPCNLIDPDSASEISLAENVQRVAMNALDEADAYHTLIQQGSEVKDIATRFGLGIRHVEQRLALSGLSSKVKAAHRRGDIHLDALRAFCIEPDHAKQEAVLRALGTPITHAAQVRAMLTQGSIRTSDRIALFVGRAAYEEAGGLVTYDLFDADTAFIADSALLTQLAEQRLDAIQGELLGAGWGWVDAQLGHAGMSVHSAQRIHPTRRTMTRTERKALATLDSEIEALEAKTNDPENEDDAAFAEEEAIQAKRRALIAKTEEWDKELIALAGVLVRVGHDGEPTFTYGIVAKAEQKKLNSVLAARAPEGKAADGEIDAAPVKEDRRPKLPKSIARELTGVRTLALRAEIAQRPHCALALTVFALAQSAHAAGKAGIDINLPTNTAADFDTLESARHSLRASFPTDPACFLDWCLAHESEQLLSMLAVLVAGALDFAHEGSGAPDDLLQSRADRLAGEVDLDMRRFWSADTAFFARLPKAMLLDIITPTISAKSQAKRDQQIAAFAKLKRDALAKAVSRATHKIGWLPELLITPIMAGGVEVTETGEAEAAAIAAE